jgi:hypothetical protein
MVDLSLLGLQFRLQPSCLAHYGGKLLSSKITIDYNQVETELLSEFTAAISIANENSGNLEGAGDVNMQSTTENSMYSLQDVPRKGNGLVAIEKISKGTRIPFVLL